MFPRLGVLGTEVAGDGVQVTVRFSKTKGAPVRLVGDDEDVEAAAKAQLGTHQWFYENKFSFNQLMSQRRDC